MSKTVYVGFKFPHMGPRAGYDLIRDHAGYDRVLDCQQDYDTLQRLSARRSLRARLHYRLFGGYMWQAELRCLWLALRERGLIFHFVYAENTYRFLGLFKWLGFRIVCTYHQPADFFRTAPAYLTGLRLVDHVIVLSPGSQAFFAGKIGRARVHFIPHGVDCAFFQPAEPPAPAREVLMVGNWMRDFRFASQVFARLLASDPALSVHVVCARANQQFFAPHPRLFLHSGIPDDELLRRYQAAALLFLPLQGYVANNAVLEMSAVGAPVLIASDQAPDAELAELVDSVGLEVEAAVARIGSLLADPGGRTAAKRAAVVARYSWPVVGQRTRQVLAAASVA